MAQSSLWIEYFKVPQGTGAIILSKDGLRYLILPFEKKQQLDRIISEQYRDCKDNQSKELLKLKKMLLKYFKGEKVDFKDIDIEIDLKDYSDFERMVYFTVQSVSYGTIWSYRDVAARIGNPRAYRAVGNALGRNPVPVIIPCHRIVCSNGSAGGFSAGGEWKTKLLQMEKIRGESR